MQMPVFILLFFAPVYVPLALLEGWIEINAKLNPITDILEAERSMLAGDEVHVGLAFSLAAVLILASPSGRCAACARRRRRAKSLRSPVSLATKSRLGAVPLGPGTVELRTWAPKARTVAVRLEDGDHQLTERTAAYRAGQVDRRPRRRLPLRSRRGRRLA